jgi:hypothetical protein
MTEIRRKLRIPRPRNPLSRLPPRPRAVTPVAGAANGPDTGEQLAGLAVLVAIAAQQDMARRASSAATAVAPAPHDPVPRGPVPHGTFPYEMEPLPTARRGGGDQPAGFLSEIDAARQKD